jgi:hypothetical protein
VDVLPLNVHARLLPLFVNTQVSVTLVPLTPKLAVAPAATNGTTDSTADADTPPQEALTAAEIVPPTARVWMVNVAVFEPAGTVTVGGTVSGSLPDSDTTVPPEGAALFKVTVPVTELPPVTLAALREIDDRTGTAVTVSVDDWLLPFIDAVMAAVPADIAVTVNVALDDPGWIVRGVCTVATAGLPLDSAMLTAPIEAAAVRLTVPWTVAPAVVLDELSERPDIATVVA